MALDFDYIVARADYLYDKVCEDNDIDTHGRYGIQSEQVKAIAKAIVEAINEESSK